MAMVIRFYEAGGPEVLRREEMVLPGPGPAEVKIQVEAIGLNRAEIAYREGRYLERPGDISDGDTQFVSDEWLMDRGGSYGMEFQS